MDKKPNRKKLDLSKVSKSAMEKGKAFVEMLEAKGPLHDRLGQTFVTKSNQQSEDSKTTTEQSIPVGDNQFRDELMEMLNVDEQAAEELTRLLSGLPEEEEE
jgi:hypothetical protein